MGPCWGPEGPSHTLKRALKDLNKKISWNPTNASFSNSEIKSVMSIPPLGKVGLKFKIARYKNNVNDSVFFILGFFEASFDFISFFDAYQAS